MAHRERARAAEDNTPRIDVPLQNLLGFPKCNLTGRHFYNLLSAVKVFRARAAVQGKMSTRKICYQKAFETQEVFQKFFKVLSCFVNIGLPYEGISRGTKQQNRLEMTLRYEI